jgi:predicted phage terminase large subunit-like protein
MTWKVSDLNVLIRQDLYSFFQLAFQETCAGVFLPNWHIEKIAETLERCRRGEIRRLIVNLPPRSLKSLCTSVAFVAWVLGHDPRAQIICASYAQDLAEKHARDCRSLMLSPRYRKLFPTRLSPDKLSAAEFVTTAGGFRLATSVGGQLTGRGGDYIIIDDPLKPDEALSDTQRKAVNDWYSSTVVSRLNDKRTGRIIVIMQRLHEDDLVGHILEKDDWTVLRFPAVAEEDEVHRIKTFFGLGREVVRRAGEALHPEREPLEALEKIRQVVGEYHYAGQYQQAPAPLGGGMIKLEWFKRYIEADKPEHFEYIVQSWDTANKATQLSDYSVCTTWGVKEKRVYLLHVLRRRLNYPDLKRAVKEQIKMIAPNFILIEDRASGTQLIQELRAESFSGITPYEPKFDKIVRMDGASSLIESGSTYLPETAPWLSTFVSELIKFPKGSHDDQVDSMSQALDWIKQRITAPEPAIVGFWRQEGVRFSREPLQFVIDRYESFARRGGRWF